MSKSARKIDQLLGDKRGLIELRKQKCVYVIPCEEQSSNLFPLVEQESSEGRKMDKGEVEVEEERQARAKSAPVLLTDKGRERRARGHACDVSKLVRGVVWKDVRQKIPTKVQRLNRRCHSWPWITDSSDVTRTWTWPRSWC